MVYSGTVGHRPLRNKSEREWRSGVWIILHDMHIGEGILVYFILLTELNIIISYLHEPRIHRIE